MEGSAIAQDAAQWRAQIYAQVGIATETVSCIEIHQLAVFAALTWKVRSLEAKIRVLT